MSDSEMEQLIARAEVARDNLLKDGNKSTDGAAGVITHVLDSIELLSRGVQEAEERRFVHQQAFHTPSMSPLSAIDTPVQSKLEKAASTPYGNGTPVQSKLEKAASTPYG